MKPLTRLIFILAFLLWLVPGIFALGAAKNLAQYKQVVWNTENGLPQSNVMSMLQTRDGYLWFGTQEGLARFNGLNFKIFDSATVPAMKSGFISDLLEDRAGRLWIGTGKGLFFYELGIVSMFNLPENALNAPINDLFEDHSGTLWIGTGNGLYSLSKGTLTFYDSSQGLSENRVRAIGEDADGNLWVGNNKGINRLRDDRFQIFSVSDGLADDKVRSIFLDSEGRLWAGCDKGLSVWQNGHFVRDSRFAGKAVREIKNDHTGHLWISGEFGISRIKGGEIETLERGKWAINGGVYRFLEDTEGSFWMGTESDGLLQLVNSKFVTFTTAQGLLSNSVYSVSQTGQHDIWVGTEKGLNRFHGGSFDISLGEQQGMPNARVTSVIEDRRGGVLIGTENGLMRWREGDTKVSKAFDDLFEKKSVRTLYRDDENNLWAGLNVGLVRLNEQTKNGVNLDLQPLEELKNVSVYALAGNLSKGLWIGTFRGLYLFKEGKLTLYTTKDGLTNNTVMSLYPDTDGSLWVGTFGGGLSRYKNGKFTSCTTENGLFNRVVYTIIPDDSGNLWMSCNRGVFSVAKNELDNFMDGRSETVKSIAYGISDGMKSFEGNGGFQASGLKSSDEKLWFATTRGIIFVDPQNMAFNPIPPPVHIEELLADNRPVALSEKQSFEAGTHRLEFHFAALSFTAPEKVRFRYRLIGYDRDWMEAENRREAVYTNLPHGEYTFQVIGSNNDDVWNETGESFNFSIAPFFYQTWWFRTLCVIISLCIFGAVYVWRVKIIQMRHAAVLGERVRIARELHDTLLQGFVGVSSQLSVVAAQFQDAPEVAERHLDVARRMIRHSVTEARRSVQNLRDDDIKRLRFDQILRATVERLAEGQTLEIKFEISGESFKLDSTTEQNLLRIAEEAMTNAFRHANASLLHVGIFYNLPLLKLEIADNGRGFDVNDAFSRLNGHFGMIGMQERAAQAGGNLAVEKIAGGGTKIVFEKAV